MLQLEKSTKNREVANPENIAEIVRVIFIYFITMDWWNGELKQEDCSKKFGKIVSAFNLITCTWTQSKKQKYYCHRTAR